MERDEDRRRKPPTDAEVRAALVAFADLVRRLDADDRLLRTLPLIMGRLGDLRHLLFEYEVRVTERLLPSESPEERESRRIVREAIEGEKEAPEEWDDPPADWS
ncbi:MAG: hypothetical protein R3266_05240 [Gemmatimonadota bacterium]|nr:hypothetical protein [Gemmatimonadota bacterium]